MDRKTIGRIFDANKDRYVEQWKELLRFRSISADPAHDADCRACAGWLANHLQARGFQSRLIETSSKPLVFAEHAGTRERPVILFYGHYDVQPADPVAEWKSPPFEPDLREGRMYARGAQDNKGQMMYALKAMETLIEHSCLDLTVKILIEGEEECGSAGINSVLPDLKDLLRADILMACDTETAASGAPAITMGLRGMTHLTLTLSGPLRDLHSGVHGGCAPNPATEMARLVAALHNPDGSVAVEGFYDGVTDPDEDERAQAEKAGFDAKAYEKHTGVPPVGGEKRFSPPVRTGFRPSIDVNGIHSGYGGAGSKTIIPARATAKLSVRLVPGQEPEQCLNAVVAHLKKRAPEGLILDISEKGTAGPALRLSTSSPLIAAARRILGELSDQEAVLRWEGASIPVMSLLAGTSGAQPLLIGFGQEEDNTHAPNESFSLARFKMGYTCVALLLSRLGGFGASGSGL